MLHQFNGSQRIGVGHVWPRQMDSLYGKLGLANAVIAGCLGILESLPDYVIKVRVHEGMRLQLATKEKPQREARASSSWDVAASTTGHLTKGNAHHSVMVAD